MICTLDLEGGETVLEVPVFDRTDVEKPFIKTVGEALGIDECSSYQDDLIVVCKGTALGTKYYFFCSSSDTNTGYKSYVSHDNFIIDEKNEDQFYKFGNDIEKNEFEEPILKCIQEFFSYPIEIYIAKA